MCSPRCQFQDAYSVSLLRYGSTSTIKNRAVHNARRLLGQLAAILYKPFQPPTICSPQCQVKDACSVNLLRYSATHFYHQKCAVHDVSSVDRISDVPHAAILAILLLPSKMFQPRPACWFHFYHQNCSVHNVNLRTLTRSAC